MITSISTENKRLSNVIDALNDSMTGSVFPVKRPPHNRPPYNINEIHIDYIKIKMMKSKKINVRTVEE